MGASAGLEFMDMFAIEFIDILAMELFMAPREENDGAAALPQGIVLPVLDGWIGLVLELQGLCAAAPQFTEVACTWGCMGAMLLVFGCKGCEN